MRSLFYFDFHFSGRFQYYMILAFLLLLLSQLNYALYYANAKPKGNFPRLGKRNERLFKEHYNTILSSATFNDKLLHPKDIFSNKQQVYSIVGKYDEFYIFLRMCGLYI